MQAIQRNKTANNNHAGRAAQQYVMGGEARASRLAKRLKGAETAPQDDCAPRYDKISKQMDDIVEGGSPQRFKRPKMESDIIAR
ncbi:hypothetical protein Herbaro_00900 [Herbaspirillum sp. WKF16]|jgi:hypothetical protein|uniref:hypothetical protein n=1 Tax=Herbaspirillum sp. WKF16 TaxID=3028312 RepID=UPI0023A9D785|nr:hypothetical protein [Herbaspirillum sp. WKF16]WDZ96369.1 hypothetical protein Herbaro_00900 [Herbaspirillum sp. WKF16]